MPGLSYSPVFQRRGQCFRIGERTANQSFGLLSLAPELLHQVLSDPLLSSSLTPSQSEGMGLCVTTMDDMLYEMEMQVLADQNADCGLPETPA